MKSVERLEEGSELLLDFGKLASVASTEGVPVLPCVVQDVASKEVVILAYVSRESLELSLREGMAIFWSTSRQELWRKGESSGDRLRLVEARVNCEQNSLLFLVEFEGEGSCHTKKSDGRSRHGCYYRRIESDLTLTFRPRAE